MNSEKRLLCDENNADLEAAYELMAQDEACEAEALEWIEGTLDEITDDAR